MIVSSLRCRSRLLAGCALMLGAAPGFAQSYPDRALQGDSTVVSGTVTVGRTPLRDTVTVASAQAIINWNPETGPLPLPPSPTPINFLPNGREAVFQGATLGQDFVVLNRILPSTNRAISINGTVTSQIVTGFGGGPPPLPTYGRGGSVWFYSPGGIIAGPTAVFNVGNLILTANDIDATGGLFSGAGAIRFRSAANSVAAVTVQPGAQFNQPNAGSYLALVSPQVTMGGTATVNGSAAYIAAEQVDMTLNGGFFSIAFLVGTGVTNALTHSGTTTGSAGNGTIAMAAMPKNTAITMLVGGTVGYTPAATATVQNGTIVLSAGQNLVFGNIDQNGSATAANLNIGSGLFRSQVNAQATNIAVAPIGGAPLTFTSNANLTGLTSASVQVDAGQSMTVGGALNLVSQRTGTGGLASITVNSGTLSVVGPTLINTSAFGLDNFVGAGGNGTGGQSRLTLNGGTVTLGGTLTVRANGIGGGGTTTSGNGIGGTATVTLNGGTSPTILNLSGLSHQINANGSINGQFPSVSGGNATGGTATLAINNGTMNTPELTVTATAIGGDATTGLGGIASGGTARTVITGGQFNTRTLTLNANEQQGAAGLGGTAGATMGTGLAAADVIGTGVLAVGATGGNSLTISADALKASARLGTPVAGGNLVAGTARLTATNGGTIITDATAPSAPKPPVLVTASVLFTDSIPGAPSASQRAGTVIVNADGGSMSLHRLDMRANALVRDFNLANDPAGPSFGGTATLAARNGGSVTVRTGEGVTPISAYATGGSTNTPALGTGGTVDVLALGGTIALPDGLSVDTRGYSGTTLGGTGGTINLRSTAGTAAQAGSLTAGTTTLDASGQIVAGLPNGIAGAITVANIGAGQTMTFADLTARAGVANGAVSGSITVTADNTPITTTAPVTGIRLGTLGTLTVNAVGAAGTIAGSTGVFGFANDIVVSHTGVAPGTTSTITGPNIQLIAGRDQIHTGSVTMRGGAVTLVGRRTLGGVDSAVFSTGDLELGSGLNASTNGILFRILDATGRLRGFQGASSYTNEITTPASFTVGERVYAGIGDIDIRAGTGIDIADAGTSATGQVLLRSTSGDVRLGTSGVALATRPNGITLNALGGTVRFTDIFSRGSINATGAAGVVGGNASAALGILATSGAGGVTVGNVQATSVTLAAATNIVAGTVFGQTGVTLTATTGSIAATAVTAPTGAIAATGSTGVDVATVTAAGPVTLSAPNGAVRVATNLAVTGNTTATGQSIFLRSLGALNFASLNATAGNLDVSSVGALSVTTPQATGSVLLASTGGNVSFGTATAGTALTVAAAGTVTGTSTTATVGPLSITGATGITIPTLFSGGTTTLSATNGAISVATNVQSAGLVTASGRSVFLRATAGLSANALTATAGNVDVSVGGSLAAANIQTSLDAILNSGAVLTPGAVTAGRDIVLTAQSVEAASLTAPRDLRIVTTGLARATGTVAATGALSVIAGQTNFQTVNGGSVTITSGQGVIFGALTSGSTVALNAGDDAIGTSVVATGNVAVTAGRNMNFGVVQAGGNATLYGNTTTGLLTVGGATIGGYLEARGASLNFGNVTAGTDAILSSYNGGLTVGNVTAGDDIFLTVNGSFANAATVSPDSQTGIVSNTVNTLVAGNLRSTGVGSDTAASGPRTFAGAGPTGNVIRVRASGAVQTGTISTGGNAIIASDLSSITTQAVSAPVGVSVFVRGNANMGDIATTGNFSIGDSSQIFSVVPMYQPFGFGGSQTSTSGGATLGSVTAANIGATTRDGLVYGSLAATGFTSWSSTLGSVTGGSLAAGTVLRIGAGGNIGFTTATAGATASLSAGGRLDGTSITGQIVDATSQGGLTLTSATATAGDVGLATFANELRAGTISASGDVRIGATDNGALSANVVLGTVTSGGNTLIEAGTVVPSSLTATTIATGGYLEARGGTLTVGDVTSGTDAILSSFAGPLTVGNVTAGDDVWLSVFNTTPFALTAGTVRSTGLGSDTAPSGNATFGTTPGGAGPAGNVIRLRSSGVVNTANISSPDRIIVVSDQARVTTGNLTAPGGIAALARTGVSLGAVDTNGLFIVRSSDQFPVLSTDYQIANLNAGSAPGSASFETLGPVNLTAVRAASVQINADAAITFNSIVTTGRVDLANAYTQGNNVTGGAITAGGTVDILSSGNIGFSTITTPVQASIAGSGTVTGTALTASVFSVTGETGVTLATAIATASGLSSGVILQATNGAVNVTNLQSLTPLFVRGRSVFLRGPGALSFNVLQATAGNIDVVATTGLTVNQATASGALVLGTGGTATVNGVATGATVSVASPDIVIAANGRLGTLGTTTQLTLTNSSTQNRTFIGGTGGAGYSLSAAELGRLTANNITIVAPVIGTASTAFNSSRLPDVSIDAFTFAANTGLGASGAFAIQTGGKVRVTGAVSFTGMGNGQTFAIRGDEAVEVLDAGRIALNGTSALGGTLDLTSRNIVASSSAALADFAAAADLKAIGDRAGKNDGAVDDGGYLQANAITATLLNSTLIIQNTGAATTTANRDYSGRRGFTVGAGGFTVVQGGTNPVRVAINGRQVGATTPLGAPTVGGFVTGLDMIPLIKIRNFDASANDIFQVPPSGVLTAAQLAAAPRLFDTTSTVNGCAITGGSGCRIVPNDPIRDILLGDFGEGSVSNLLPLSLVQLREYVTPEDEPLIDEPVTGAGNDDLWSVDDAKAKCDPAKEKCPS